MLVKILKSKDRQKKIVFEIKNGKGKGKTRRQVNLAEN